MKTAKEAIGGMLDPKAGKTYGKEKPVLFIDTLLNIAATLGRNIGRVEYGECSCICKIHGGRIASICYSTTENQIQKAAAEGAPEPNGGSHNDHT